MIDELPLSDELDRKAIEALIRIADEQSRSLMSEREARLATRRNHIHLTRLRLRLAR